MKRRLDGYGDWLSVDELATYWDASSGTIYSMVKDGSIAPVVRLGARGQIRIPLSTILRMEGRLYESDGITEVKSPNTTEPDAAAHVEPRGSGWLRGDEREPRRTTPRSHSARRDAGLSESDGSQRSLFPHSSEDG